MISIISIHCKLRRYPLAKKNSRFNSKTPIMTKDIYNFSDYSRHFIQRVNNGKFTIIVKLTDN
ncbi:MAG: hypothetical protein AUJ11_03240 [Parcubacteria group bacterium CG1_02_44_65]|uniref:Uncharacterized protein n=1 Tax=Candidatus Portnoybacteria bacterium CG_4_10_14_0_2_um_filter_43_36 TaxID=1974798 RepID=A0A2M7UDW3_9BACT|nr:MAG: hypothetical protein AUJ11_03240 [Parcubacteria group bacterium CG1_02_44_65]PIZ69420.1 MAG: hypothetical protein COY10_01550 [Candidatus Portnoybacteria bacterium CG_4_10_14_0_2_um_filter_43_36]